jgi:lipid II:glycine glycyltransferase (peptidoglycan interpeptide bridge formation enzyme)
MSNAFDGLEEGVIGVPVYETYMLALPERPDLLHLNSSIKRAINKATRLGVQVRQAQTESDLRAWYELYVQTMRKLIVLPYPYHYYKVAWRRLYSSGLLRLLLAERIEAGQRRLLGGIIIVLYGQTVSFFSGGWREEDQSLRPNDVLHWQAIQDACAEGFRWYDFGDVELGNQGLAKFKSKWGSEAKMVYDYSYPAFHEAISHVQDLSKHPAYRLVRASWAHLPIKAIWLLSDWYHALRF